MKIKNLVVLALPLFLLSGLAFATVGEIVDPVQDQVVHTVFPNGVPNNALGCTIYVGSDPSGFHYANNVDWALFVADQASKGNVVSPFYIFYSQAWQMYGWTSGQVHYWVWGDSPSCQ